MDVRRQAVRFVERANADEAHLIAGAGVVAPQGDPAMRTARDLLALAAVRRRVHDLGRPLEQNHAVSLDHRVECKSSPALTLTPAAMAAVHEYRLGCHSVAHGTTGAAAFEGEVSVAAHGIL